LAPLVWAEGASEIARRSVSTPVFVGMLAASTIGIFLIPMLYVVFQTLREKTRRKSKVTPTSLVQPAESSRTADRS
jgi:Cu/Ag efflux pump CusA